MPPNPPEKINDADLKAAVEFDPEELKARRMRRLSDRSCALAAALPVCRRRNPTPTRQRELVRLVRQDCGSCHGMTLNGGLGPALTREALADKPAESLAAIIVHGRPGTPMPPWRTFVARGRGASGSRSGCVAGFPQEAR